MTEFMIHVFYSLFLICIFCRGKLPKLAYSLSVYYVNSMIRLESNLNTYKSKIMFKYLSLALILSCYSFSGYSQTMLSGKIIDEETAESIPFANILVESTFYGTASNVEGEFSLKIESFPVTLRISSLGYETKLLRLDNKQDSNLEINLVPFVASLGEVDVTGDFEVKLVEKAVKKLTVTEDEKIIGKGFYRQLTQSDSVYTEFIETFYLAELYQRGIKGWKVQNGRFAVISRDSLKSRMTFADFSRISLRGILDKKPYREEFIWPIREDVRKYYDFYLSETYQQNDKKVYVIEYSPKENVSEPAFTGKIAIVDKSYAIEELHMTISHPEYKPVETVKKKTKSEKHVVQIVYRNSFLEGNGQYYPKSLNVDISFDYIKKKGLFGKVDFKRRVHTSSVLYFFDYEVDSTLQYFTDDYFTGADDKTSDYAKINETEYNSTFWVNNPIIKRTPVERKVIESFEKYGSFGKMFNKESEQY